MHRGCVSLGDIKCGGCRKMVPHSKRYLVVEKDGKVTNLCVDCCLEKGLAHYKEDKGEQVLTFFTGELGEGE